MDKFEGYNMARHLGKPVVVFSYMWASNGNKITYEEGSDRNNYVSELKSAENQEAAGFYQEPDKMTKAKFCAERVENKCVDNRCQLALKTLYGSEPIKNLKLTPLKY